ncbi:uncharacterized protein UV8b_04337 [Ustilaginoidea virens]|uniref:Uncharacterized protein n=1 Tax=Ustilaginoidea virens TaxID=1159556 RepID=A0A8E5HR89_USTVR|nr:uncharacterized protein UV8b_04337 [Ustilaginoidea virens]QUC20096.1 hypothetical protein UV8b_04337 [Ustilaginoidea virens]
MGQAGEVGHIKNDDDDDGGGGDDDDDDDDPANNKGKKSPDQLWNNPVVRLHKYIHVSNQLVGQRLFQHASPLIRIPSPPLQDVGMGALTWAAACLEPQTPTSWCGGGPRFRVQSPD